LIGERVSHYRIIEKLGSGGMGEVYAAEDEHLRRRVAIKFPNLDDVTGKLGHRFQMEARAASALTHANIARIYDYGESPDGRPFLVMELVEGTSLRNVLRAGRLTATRASAVAAGILRALAEAHSNGLVHRDIKPANVMLTESGEVKVLDFGLAKRISGLADHDQGPEDETLTAGLTVPGTVVGTVPYMSPEQARGANVDARSDLFSTGLVLYECLTGVPPFPGSGNREVLNQILTANPMPPSSRVPELPRTWDRIIARALQKDRDQRYQSAHEMLAALEQVGESKTRLLTRKSVSALTGTKKRAASTGLIAAALILAAILLIRIGRPHEPSAAAMDWYRRGAIALRDGTYYAAARMLQKAVDLDGDYALAHARLAEAANELDDSARASTEMLAALPRGSAPMPGGTSGMYIDAIHRTLNGDFTGAVTVYRSLAEKVPPTEKAAALVDLGRVYEKSSQGAKALEAFRQALGLDAQNAAAHLWAGKLLGRQRNPQYSTELDRAFALYQALSNTEGQAEVLYQRGLLLSSVDIAGARIALQKAKEMARTIPSEQQDVAATLQLSTVAYLSGDMEQAEQLASDGVERARRAGMNYLAARGLAEIGNTQFLKRDYKRAATSYRESLDLARRFRMRRAEARAQFGLANVHQTDGPIGTAATEAASALAYFREAGFQIEAIQCLMVMSRAHRDTGYGVEAAADSEQALAAARQLSDPVRAQQAQQTLASVMLAYGRWPEAIVQFEQSRQAAAALNDRANVIRALNGKADALWRLGSFDDADSALAEASHVVEELPAQLRPSQDMSILYRRAEILLSRGRNAEAASLARQIHQSQTATAQTAQNAACLAGVAMARSGQGLAARRLCESAIQSMEPDADLFTLAEARMALAEIALAQGDTSAAGQALDMVIDWTDRVKDRETGWRAWALRARALQRRGDVEGAVRAEQKASDLRTELGWDPVHLQGYLARPDIRLLTTPVKGAARR
jgi:tetratricopeptide (TPR) repeat protein/predicted Ser/Thr protein kinase